MKTSQSGLFSQDDRMLEGASRQAISEVNRFFSKERVERAATQGERQRLARELHDGVLQSLTGAALQLEALSRLMEADPKAAQERLRAIEALIAEQQCELRGWIEQSRPSAPIATTADLAAALDKLRARVEWQWGLRVELSVDSRGSVPRILGDQIYRIVQEALTNTGRHARASVARVNIRIDIACGLVHVTVSDDGCGFPFRGRYNIAELTARQIGPRSLLERIISLRGELVLTSELSGSQLEINLPQDQPLRAARNFTHA